MNKAELEAMMEAFQSKGGAIKEVKEGERSEYSLANERVRFCKCGCEGNYTDHSMRQGEGRFSDQ